MDNETVKLLGAAVVAIFLMIGLVVDGRVDDFSTIDAVLTKDGCAYVESIGIKPKQENGMCKARMRYWHAAFGSSGQILLDNDRHINVTSNMMVAYSKASEQLPQTSGQRATLVWSWIWFASAGLVAVIIAIYSFMTRKRG